MKNDEKWMMHYEELRLHVAAHGHFPDKHSKLCNWVKYQRKRLKAGLMTEEQHRLFETLAESRSNEHTGGRRKKIVVDEPSMFCPLGQRNRKP